MQIEVTREEIRELGQAMIIAGESPRAMEINWEIITKFLAKLDK